MRPFDQQHVGLRGCELNLLRLLPRAREARFSRSFLRSAPFRCKTVQLCETPYERRTTKLPGVSNDMQSSETLRNSLGLNYETAALPAELRRRGVVKHCIREQSEQASEAGNPCLGVWSSAFSRQPWRAMQAA